MEVRFQIELHRKDEELLKLIQAYFGGVGAIYPVGKGCSAFRASTVDHILKIILLTPLPSGLTLRITVVLHLTWPLSRCACMDVKHH